MGARAGGWARAWLALHGKPRRRAARGPRRGRPRVPARAQANSLRTARRSAVDDLAGCENGSVNGLERSL
eukprot:scaffold1987_cov72-Isochrysis_galbana.AAC.3